MTGPLFQLPNYPPRCPDWVRAVIVGAVPFEGEHGTRLRWELLVGAPSGDFTMPYVTGTDLGASALRALFTAAGVPLPQTWEAASRQTLEPFIGQEIEAKVGDGHSEEQGCCLPRATAVRPVAVPSEWSSIR
jgi:hypothetical protein